MLNYEQITKLQMIRDLLYQAYDHYFKYSPDTHHKSNEGCIEINFGNYFNSAIQIGIYSYVFGPSRMHYFDSIDEALAAVREWHANEMTNDYSDVMWP